MAKIENKLTFETILSDLKNRNFYPIYFLMGEEPYFIDKISNYIEQNVVSDEEKDMNLKVLYGKETKMEQVIMEARQFPFMADYRVVIVKEAQNLEKNIDKIELYLQNMPKTTILVFCYKYTKFNHAKSIKIIENKGVLFHSATLYDNQVPAWVTKYCKSQKVSISIQAANLLSEYIGNDLSRIAGEIDKLLISISNKGEITPELIEKNVGISKDFNSFELSKALFAKDVMLANRIVAYFGNNPKDFVIQPLLVVLFGKFCDLMHYHLLTNKSQHNVAAQLGINPFFVKEYVQASQFYSQQKLREIIAQIRIADAKSKGYGSINNAPAEILKELVFMILH